MKLNKGTLVRGILFVLAWVNNILAAKGMKTIPVLDSQTVATIITVVITGYTFYKDNFKGKKITESVIVKDAEAVIEKVVETKVAPQPEAKPEPVVVPVTPSNQPIQPDPVAPVAPAEPVAQPVQPTVPESK